MEFCFREDFQPARHETHGAKLLFHSESREVSLRRGVQVPAGQQVLLASFICGLFHLAFFFFASQDWILCFRFLLQSCLYGNAVKKTPKQFCSSPLSHIGTEKHLISNGSSALCRLCTCLKSSAGLLDASQFDMGLLHRDNHNLSSWKMLLHYHCGFLFNLTIACLHLHSQTRNEWNRNGNTKTDTSEWKS